MFFNVWTSFVKNIKLPNYEYRRITEANSFWKQPNPSSWNILSKKPKRNNS